MFYNQIDDRINTIQEKLFETYEQILDSYTFGKMSGKVLDDYASLFGITRLSSITDAVHSQYIKITFNEPVENYTIPAATRFYINGSVYCETTVDELFSGSEAYVDVVFPQVLDSNSNIPISTIQSVQSLNSDIRNHNITTSYAISSSEASETDAQFKIRICEYISGKNLNTYDRIHYIFKTLNLTDYAIDTTNKLLAGTCVVYLNPPVYEDFDSYCEKVYALAKEVLFVTGLSIIIKRPLIRELHILNYTDIPAELVKYISELKMGDIPDLSIIQEYAGNNIVIKLDGEVVSTPIIKYNEKVQLFVDDNIE